MRSSCNAILLPPFSSFTVILVRRHLHMPSANNMQRRGATTVVVALEQHPPAKHDPCFSGFPFCGVGIPDHRCHAFCALPFQCDAMAMCFKHNLLSVIAADDGRVLSRAATWRVRLRFLTFGAIVNAATINANKSDLNLFVTDTEDRTTQIENNCNFQQSQ